MTMRYLLSTLLLTFLLTGCGDFNKRLKLINDVTHDMTKQGHPALTQMCSERLALCKAQGQNETKLCTPGMDKAKCLALLQENCPGFKTCYAVQRHMTSVANGIHVSCATAAAARAVGDEETATAMLSQAMAGLVKLKDLVKESGLLDVLKGLKGGK